MCLYFGFVLHTILCIFPFTRRSKTKKKEEEEEKEYEEKKHKSQPFVWPCFVLSVGVNAVTISVQHRVRGTSVRFSVLSWTQHTMLMNIYTHVERDININIDARSQHNVSAAIAYLYIRMHNAHVSPTHSYTFVFFSRVQTEKKDVCFFLSLSPRQCERDSKNVFVE